MSAEAPKKPVGPVTVEQGFKVDGRKLTVLVTFPAAIASEFGMETVVTMANRALVSIESKNHEVARLRGE